MRLTRGPDLKLDFSLGFSTVSGKEHCGTTVATGRARVAIKNPNIRRDARTEGETMKRQIVKGTTMLLLVVALSLVTAVVANSQSRLARADVPWEFNANNTTLPAGHYNIGEFATGSGVVKISNTQEAKNVFAMTLPLSRKGNSEKGKLVFHRYGNRYFLAEIWVAGEREGQKLRKSKEEKAIENEMAIISSKTELPQRTYELVEVALVRN
jgi:hypothetical protein